MYKQYKNRSYNRTWTHFRDGRDLIYVLAHVIQVHVGKFILSLLIMSKNRSTVLDKDINTPWRDQLLERITRNKHDKTYSYK